MVSLGTHRTPKLGCALQFSLATTVGRLQGCPVVCYGAVSKLKSPMSMPKLLPRLGVGAIIPLLQTLEVRPHRMRPTAPPPPLSWHIFGTPYPAPVHVPVVSVLSRR